MENEQNSPMKNNLMQQTSRIMEIIGNAQLFKAHYDELTENIISSLNQQLKSYNKNAKQSIKVDIYDMVVESINWNELQKQLTQKLQSKSPNVKPAAWINLPKLIVSKLSVYDDDAITNMYINCDESTVKEFSKYRKLAISELNNLSSSLDEFESSLINYRSLCVQHILSNNIQPLFDIHYNYVNDLFHKKNPSNVVQINGKQLTIQKSQKEFIKSALKALII